jgi:hypothetical protein
MVQIAQMGRNEKQKLTARNHHGSDFSKGYPSKTTTDCDESSRWRLPKWIPMKKKN